MCITGDTAAIREARAWPEGEETKVGGGDAILAEYCYNSLFEKLWLVRNGGNGLNLHICYEDPRVVSCVISYNRKAGLRMEECHDIAVSASHFEENYQEGLLAIDTWNIAASGNDFDDNHGSAVVLKGCVGCPLSGNLYTNSPEWGLVLDNCRGNTLTGEIIRRNLGKGGVLLKNSSFNTITGCSFDSNDSLALVIGKGSQQNSITGNVVTCLQSADKTMGIAIAGRNNIVSANIIAPGRGFGLILSGENQNVSGNTFVSAQGDGFILIENLRNSSVRGNILRGRDNVPALSTPIMIRGSNSGNRILDNR
jgi:parallel beta-helix repeat protein